MQRVFLRISSKRKGNRQSISFFYIHFLTHVHYDTLLLDLSITQLPFPDLFND